MNELTNFVTANGTYNNLETVIQSNESTTILVNELEIEKKVNKTKWTTDNLLYTLVIKNPTDVKFKDVIVTDILNPLLVFLIVESVRINGIPVGYNILSYDKNTGMIVINLPTIEKNQIISIEFQVKKQKEEIFKIENYATLIFENNTLISNTVSTIALAKICKCK